MSSRLYRKHVPAAWAGNAMSSRGSSSARRRLSEWCWSLCNLEMLQTASYYELAIIHKCVKWALIVVICVSDDIIWAGSRASFSTYNWQWMAANEMSRRRRLNQAAFTLPGKYVERRMLGMMGLNIDMILAGFAQCLICREGSADLMKMLQRLSVTGNILKMPFHRARKHYHE